MSHVHKRYTVLPRRWSVIVWFPVYPVPAKDPGHTSFTVHNTCVFNSILEIRVLYISISSTNCCLQIHQRGLILNIYCISKQVGKWSHELGKSESDSSPFVMLQSHIIYPHPVVLYVCICESNPGPSSPPPWMNTRLQFWQVLKNIQLSNGWKGNVSSNKQLPLTPASSVPFCRNNRLTCSSMLSITVRLPPRALQSSLLSNQFFFGRDADLEWK